MAGRYGMSFAKSLIEKGDYEEAVEAATAALEGGDKSPEPFFDRATALDLLERFDDAVGDFERAITMNLADKELDPFVIDDAYFSALLAAARAAKDATRLERYAKLLPDGAHAGEARDWQKRLRGELPSLLDKTKSLDVP